MNKERKAGINFEEFFPIFRDSILGVTFMHINNIACRHIQPKKIVKINSNKYKLLVNGEEINLSNLNKYI